MEGIPADASFLQEYVKTAKPTCGFSETPPFSTNPLGQRTALGHFDDTNLTSTRESEVKICVAPPGSLHNPRNLNTVKVACSECSYGWARPENDSDPLMCKPGTRCQDQPEGCHTCVQDTTHFWVREPCSACIGDPICVNGQCSCH